ncbi:MAG: AraC family transcriptional regulator [Spirochaetes bacterium]|nr:AraC family transcriptional regulator [Spirochaetota bacterium]
MIIERIGMYEGASRTAHYHECYEMRYIVDGECVLKIGDDRHRLTPGLAAFTAPREGHTVVYDERRPIVQYLMLFTLDEKDGELAEHLARLAKKRVIGVGEGKAYFFETLRMKMESQSRRLSLSGVHQCISFLYGLGEDAKRDVDASHPRIEKALAILHKSLSRHTDVVSLSHRAGLERSYFIRTFRKATGLTPMKYLMRLKVEAACSLLSRTDMSVAAIAERFRFSDQYHFSRTFKQMMGVAPIVYRKNGGDVGV